MAGQKACARGRAGQQQAFTAQAAPHRRDADVSEWCGYPFVANHFGAREP